MQRASGDQQFRKALVDAVPRLRRTHGSRFVEQALTRGVSALAQSALRHGGLDEVSIVVRGSEIDIAPVTPASAKVVLGEDLRDLGAAVAVRLVDALGGTVSLDGETLTVQVA